MHHHHSLLQIAAEISHVVMVTENVVEASYHAWDWTSIKPLSMTDWFNEHVPEPSIHCACIQWK